MIPVCPKCDVGLFILKFNDVEADYCERCRGVWLDTGEFEQLAGIAALELRETSATSVKHLCPRCDQSLREVIAGSNITLDRCPHGHGLWFDADELQKLLGQFPGSQLNAVFANT